MSPISKAARSLLRSSKSKPARACRSLCSSIVRSTSATPVGADAHFAGDHPRAWLRLHTTSEKALVGCAGFSGGMLATCGLRNVGPSSQEGSESFGLHGEISYAPATSVSSRTYWDDGRYCIEIYGEMRESYPFGPNLVLRRTWRTELGADWVDLEDIVTNEGFRPELHMRWYHWNFGYPFLTERSTLSLTTDLVTGRDDAAREGLARWQAFELPASDFAEQVFYHSYSEDAPEITRARIVSDPGESALAVEISYPSSQLPDLSQWKCCRQGVYVLGIEPGNCRPEGRDLYRNRTGKSLAPGTPLDSTPGCAYWMAHVRLLPQMPAICELALRVIVLQAVLPGPGSGSTRNQPLEMPSVSGYLAGPLAAISHRMPRLQMQAANRTRMRVDRGSARYVPQVERTWWWEVSIQKSHSSDAK